MACFACDSKSNITSIRDSSLGLAGTTLGCERQITTAGSWPGWLVAWLAGITSHHPYLHGYPKVRVCSRSSSPPDQIGNKVFQMCTVWVLDVWVNPNCHPVFARFHCQIRYSQVLETAQQQVLGVHRIVATNCYSTLHAFQTAELYLFLWAEGRISLLPEGTNQSAILTSDDCIHP